MFFDVIHFHKLTFLGMVAVYLLLQTFQTHEDPSIFFVLLVWFF